MKKNNDLSSYYKIFKYLHVYEFNKQYYILVIISSAFYEISKEMFDLYNLIIYKKKSIKDSNFLKFKSEFKIGNNTVKESIKLINIIDRQIKKDKRIKHIAKIINLFYKPKLKYKIYSINTSTLCNFKCVYCFRKESEKKEKSLLKEDIDIILDYIIKDSKGISKIFINYELLGEPLLDFENYKYVIKRVKEIEKEKLKDIWLGMLTNGYLLDNEKIEWLNNNKALFGISIDGDEEYHNSLRKTIDGKDTYIKIKKNIETVFKYDWSPIPPGASVTLTAKNYDIKRIFLHLYNMGFRTIISKPIRISKESDLFLKGESLEKLKNSYFELIELFLNNIRKGDINYLKAIINETDYFGRFFIRVFKNRKIIKRCGAGENNITITSEGDIYCCDSLAYNAKFKIGNILSNKINNKNKIKDVNNKVECAKCFAKYFCGGNCEHISISVTGESNKIVSEECDLNIYLIKLASYLLIEIIKENSDMYEIIKDYINLISPENIKDEIKKEINEQYKKIYSNSYYTIQEYGSLKSAEIIVPMIINEFNPKSVIDVGCGIGSWLSVFYKNGITDFIGLDTEFINSENLKIPKDRFLKVDICKPINISEKYDLAVSLEVAEHIPEEFIDIYIESLIKLSDLILFSGAIPLQGDIKMGHVNEKWQSEWIKIFENKGYYVYDAFRKRIWDNINIEPWYIQNMFVFINKKVIDNYKIIVNQINNSESYDIIHPRMYLMSNLWGELKKNNNKRNIINKYKSLLNENDILIKEIEDLYQN